MIVKCASCQTEFSLDDRQVGAGGVTVRCSMCSHVFQVKPGDGRPDEQPWQIRTVDELLFTAPDLKTLRRWMIEDRLHPDDRVSRTGRTWLRLGDMPEFSDAFKHYSKELRPVLQPVVVAPPKASERAPIVPPVAAAPSVGSFAPPTAQPPVAAVNPQAPAPQAAIAGQSTVEATTPNQPTSQAQSTPSMTVGGTGHSASMRFPAPSASQLGSDEWSAEEPKKSRWPWAVAFLLVGGAAVAFALPESRNQILQFARERGLADEQKVASKDSEKIGSDDSPSVELMELHLADSSLNTLSLKAMDRADEGLVRTLGKSGLSEREKSSLQLARADIALHKSLLYSMASSIDATEGPELRRKSDQARDDARKVLQATQSKANLDAPKSAGSGMPASSGGKADPRQRRVDTLMALAEGKDPAELERLLPSEGAEDLVALIKSEALWSDPEVSPEAIAKAESELTKVSRPSGLVRAASLLAKFRRGGSEAARSDAQLLAAGAVDHPVASTIVRMSDISASPTETEEAKKAEAPPVKEATKAKEDAPASDAAVAVATKNTAGSSKASGGGASRAKPKPNAGKASSGGTPKRLDQMIDVGCSKVESGDASGGVKVLIKAFDKAPQNLDVLICLANGYKKSGKSSRALYFYERILGSSSKHISALRGAARMSEKLGRDPKAMEYYKRLLTVAPNDSRARKYVEANGG